MSEVFSREIVAATMEELKIGSLSSATIGQMLLLAATLERKTGIPFVRMDQGIPGLKPCEIGMAAEKEAHENSLKKGLMKAIFDANVELQTGTLE